MLKHDVTPCALKLSPEVAYPNWDDSLLSELGDAEMERLFREANLEGVWEQRKGDLDNPAISWVDVPAAASAHLDPQGAGHCGIAV